VTGAVAIRVLDVAVLDEATKDRAQALPLTDQLKVHKRDYLVEVLGVPLSTKVVSGK